ncbi:hypothetical protein [Streptomyces sp. NPDC056672]|uniref:hypothetical protein n=1 Tax=Streptomyces sp. NPDC056672 TaxID=3345906 RepID=UPI00369CBAD8
MSMDALLDLRADVVVRLRAWGWVLESEGVLERNGAQWAVTNPVGDSQVTAGSGSYSVPFDSDVPADVIATACRAAAGDPAAAPDPRTAALSEALAAALAERTEDTLEAADADYNNAVFDVVRAITALADTAPAAPAAPAPAAARSEPPYGAAAPFAAGLLRANWALTYAEDGRLCVPCDDVEAFLRSVAAAWRTEQPSAAGWAAGALDGIAGDLAASFTQARDGHR